MPGEAVHADTMHKYTHIGQTSCVRLPTATLQQCRVWDLFNVSHQNGSRIKHTARDQQQCIKKLPLSVGWDSRLCR